MGKSADPFLINLLCRSLKCGLQGNTALHHAQGDHKTVRLLLAAGANVNAANRKVDFCYSYGLVKIGSCRFWEQ